MLLDPCALNSCTMIELTSFIVLCVLVGSNYADRCEYNMTINDLPGGFLTTAVDIIIMGASRNLYGCPEKVSVPSSSVMLWLYNRTSIDTPVLLNLNRPSKIDANKRTILLAHGWLCNRNNDRMPELRAAYLSRYDANVIQVDWSRWSSVFYTESYCKLPVIGKMIGTFLCKLSSTLGVDISKVHMIGHSMGAQLSGFTGQEVQQQCGQKLGRITALDPAGPIYQTQPPNKRLDPSDANFVDVIHTNMGIMGYHGSCGTVDFFPNCGVMQPGCLQISNFDGLLNYILGIFHCSHIRSLEFMAESVNSVKFMSRTYKQRPGQSLIGACVEDDVSPKYSYMGEDCSHSSPADAFYLETNSEPPYARG